MSRSYKDMLDIEEQYRRIVQLRADIRQKRLEMYYLPGQVYIGAVVAGAAVAAPSLVASISLGL